MEWKLLQLGELVDYRNGLWAGKKGELTRAKVIRVTEMKDNGSYDLSTAKELQVEARKLTTRKVIPNSILLERSGGGENKPVGRVIIFGEDVLKDVYSFSNFTTLLLPKADTIFPKYIFYSLYFFHLSGKTKQLQKAVTGIRNLEFTKYLEQEIPVPFKNNKPDLTEQKRIADKLDKVSAEIEKATKTLSKNVQNASSFGISVMRQLLTTSKLGEIELGKILNLQNGRAFKETDWSTKGLPIVRIQNLNNPEAKFNHYELPVEARFLIDSGDFLISWSGTPGTSFGAFIWQRGKAILNQHIFNAVPTSNKFSKRYLRYAVNEKLDEIIFNAHGGVGLRHITKADLVKVKLPTPLKDGEPDLARQEKIADELDKRFAMSEQLQILFTRQEKLFVSLRSSVLNQLFQTQT